MSLRIRSDGRVLCAAMHPPAEGDIYVADADSYRLTVMERALVTEPMHAAGGRGGHAVHGEWWWRGLAPADAVLEGAP